MSAELPISTCEEPALQVYLLGCVDFETVLRLQRLLHFEVTGDRRRAALIVCEHPPLISVGRLGSRRHIHLEPDELHLRRWPIRWVNRGGGCLLHVPGQVALYPILPLDRLRFGIAEYLQRMTEAIRATLDDFTVHAEVRCDNTGVWVGPRLLAAVGVSVRDWVTSFGAYVNVHPRLDLFRPINVTPNADQPMTSLERERRGPVRAPLVRERLIERFRERFGFSRIALFSDHPSLVDAISRSPAPALDAERTWPC